MPRSGQRAGCRQGSEFIHHPFHVQASVSIPTNSLKLNKGLSGVIKTNDAHDSFFAFSVKNVGMRTPQKMSGKSGLISLRRCFSVPICIWPASNMFVTASVKQGNLAGMKTY
jgi:hypothetical protein